MARSRLPRLPRLPRRTGRRRIVLGALAALLLVGLVLATGLAAGGDDPATEVAQEELRLEVGPEQGGEPVDLDVSVFTPEGGTPGADREGRRAAVLLAHGFGGSKDDTADLARDLAADGYVAVTWTARGFGDSGGLIHLDSPDYEVADVSVLLDRLAARDDVRLDGEGDPVVGIAGGSYGGAVALMAAGYDDRVDAIVPAITWHDLGEALFPQNAVRGVRGGEPGAGVFKQRWASLFVSGALAAGDAEADTDTEADADTAAGGPSPGAGAGSVVCGRFAPDVCRLFARAATSGRADAATLERLRVSSPAPVLDAIQAPTLLVQGAQDSLFGLDQADANARGIAAGGTEVAVRWIDGGHDAAGSSLGETDLTEPALGWFDHHLRGGPDPGVAFDLALPAPRLGDDGPTRLRTDSYGERGETALTLEGDTQPVLSPAGGEPAAITGLPGAGAALGAAAAFGGGAAFGLAVLPGQSAVFESETVDQTVTVAGAPRVRLSLASSAPEATLFVSGWIVSADDVPALPRQLVSPVRLDDLSPGRPVEVEVTLPSSAYRLEPGERLRVVVASTDAAFAVPEEQRLYRVGLAAPEVVLPTVDAARVDAESLAPMPLVVGVGTLLLAAGALALAARRRSAARAAHCDPELAEVPLEVAGLVKEYSDGFRAVDDVSWRAERGQVVGLLGPNGAGKTTTMRMLVGLIHADAGTVHVHGEPVAPGAAVLGRVGALIEGPGFLPHLTGRQNLDAWWAATGRPAGEARMEEALEVADLGAAVDRPVRSYSHGMRQRLGIAQAMLGMPEVLLLDEPTNGLDPPQIRGFRGVLARYAATGRTVVVSSHLLAEVEQTCSHVVVMHRGRVVLAGAVRDLLTDATSTVLWVGGDAQAAVPVLSGVPGVDAVIPEEDRLRVEGEAARPDLVAALVDAGIPVLAVDGRRHLEEVFMSLVGDDSAAQLARVEAGAP